MGLMDTVRFEAVKTVICCTQLYELNSSFF